MLYTWTMGMRSVVRLVGLCLFVVSIGTPFEFNHHIRNRATRVTPFYPWRKMRFDPWSLRYPSFWGYGITFPTYRQYKLAEMKRSFHHGAFKTSGKLAKFLRKYRDSNVENDITKPLLHDSKLYFGVSKNYHHISPKFDRQSNEIPNSQNHPLLDAFKSHRIKNDKITADYRSTGHTTGPDNTPIQSTHHFTKPNDVLKDVLRETDGTFQASHSGSRALDVPPTGHGAEPHASREFGSFGGEFADQPLVLNELWQSGDETGLIESGESFNPPGESHFGGFNGFGDDSFEAPVSTDEDSSFGMGSFGAPNSEFGDDSFGAQMSGFDDGSFGAPISGTGDRWFGNDKTNCVDIDTKSCSYDADCNCLGLYVCLRNRCIEQSTSGSVGDAGGFWHEGPIIK